MARWAIGDLQGCDEEFEALLGRIGFRSDRDELWLVGDLVNRGPRSLQVLRRVHSLGDNVVCVLGNHDLHLLAVALGGARQRRGDTLDEVLAAPDRDVLLEWLLARPLAYFDAGDLMVHAGVVPQWTVEHALAMAGEVQRSLRDDPSVLLSQMYADQPDRWSDGLTGIGRLRLAVNILTRLRFCTRTGRIDPTHKGPPGSAGPEWLPWFTVPERASRSARVVFGHWSALGWHRADGVLGLDTGCVWGGALTAVDLDRADAAPVSVPSRQPRSIEG